jgi:hypothetical protein
MSDTPQSAQESLEETASVHQLLLRLDLATEVLEGLDELGLETRAEVEQLLVYLERQIADLS